MLKFAPSILSADFRILGEQIEETRRGGAEYVHIDVMDGNFVPQVSFGDPVIKTIRPCTDQVFDVHLMVVHPERWFERLAQKGVAYTSFHLEAAGRRTSSCISAIHSLGMKAGVAIDPDVPVKKLFPYIGKADFFLIMSVFAGFGGQKFIYESLSRIEELRAEIAHREAQALIEVDGGVGLSNATALREAGADILVAGSSVFRSEDPAASVGALRVA